MSSATVPSVEREDAVTHAMSKLSASGEVFSGFTPLAGLSAVCDLEVELLCAAQVRMAIVASITTCGAHQNVRRGTPSARSSTATYAGVYV